MNKLIPSFRIFALSALTLSVASCVSDIDFDQGEDIILSQEVDLDLIFFSLDQSNFEGANTDEQSRTARDTTRLEFLNDAVFQENLKQIEFTFKVENTFGQSLINRSRFLNDAGMLQYEIVFDIPASMDGEVVETIIIENLTQEEIDALRRSIQVVSDVSIQINNAPIEGTAIVQSKALYFLEFSDL